MNMLEVIDETNNWLAINKPAGLLSIPDREGKDASVKSILQQKHEQIFTVHRLDKETSGIILFAKNEVSHKFLSQQFESKTIEKYYWGIVNGVPTENRGRIETGIAEHPVKKGIMTVSKNGKISVTDYEVLEEFGKYSLLQFQIYTGRMHQIRVHAQHICHPIVCDEWYGDGKPVFISSLKRNFKLSKNSEEESPILSRLGLHAGRLKFTDRDATSVDLKAPLSKDMKALLQQLRKWKSVKR